MYIAFDCETGGLTTEFDLLTAHFLVLDENYNLIEELGLALKPMDRDYKVEQGAMDVNKINLVEHDKIAISYEEGAKKLKELLKKYKPARKRTWFKAIGQNIPFDIRFIAHYLLGGFDPFNPTKAIETVGINKGLLDTHSLTVFLKQFGYLPDELGSLTSLVGHFGIKTEEFHTCRGDILMTVEVWKKYVDMFKNFKLNATGGSSGDDLLEVIEQ